MRVLISFISCCLLACGLMGAALAAPVDGGHARVEFVKERAVTVTGEPTMLGLAFELDPKWHIYWRNAGDAGIPPSIKWTATSGISEAAFLPFEWPLPEELPIIPNELMDYGYSDQVVLPFALDVPVGLTGDVILNAQVEYLICKDICIPESVELDLVVTIGEAPQIDARGSALIAESLSTVPVMFDGEVEWSSLASGWSVTATGAQASESAGPVRFFPFAHEIFHAAPQPVERITNGVRLAITPQDAATSLPEQLGGVLQIGDKGFELPAPFVPVDPEPHAFAAGATTTNGILSESTAAETESKSLQSSITDAAEPGPVNLPVLMLLALIGGLILNLMPCVLPVLSIKAMGVVSSVANGNANEARQHGIAYTAGVLASFAALATVIVMIRPQGGSVSWGFWMQDPIIVTLLALIIFAVGLWLLGLFELGGSVQNVGDSLARKDGLVGAFFTGVLAVIVGAPCTGPFLGVALGASLGAPAPAVFAVLLAMGLGLALPFLLLSFVPQLQKLMPKPGVWMDTLKQAFAFPMFLAAAYFLWTLGDVTDSYSVAITAGGAAAVAFGLWALSKHDQGGRVILFGLLGIVAIIPLFGLLSGGDTSELVGNLVGLAVIVGLFVAAMKVPEGTASLAVRGLAIVAIIAGFGAPVWRAHTSSVAPTSLAGGGAPKTVGNYEIDYPVEPWSPQRVAELTAQGKSVFVDFTATWCVNCQVNKRKVLKTEAVLSAFREAGVAYLVADYTKRNAVIKAELESHDRAGVPLYLFYPAGQAQPQVLPELLSVSLVTGLARSN